MKVDTLQILFYYKYLWKRKGMANIHFLSLIHGRHLGSEAFPNQPRGTLSPGVSWFSPEISPHIDMPKTPN